MKKYTGLVWGAIILAFIGLSNAFYLVQAHITGEPLNCNILNGCNAVAASPYSIVFGVPLSSWGVVFYLGIFILAALLLAVRARLLAHLFVFATAIGFLASLYFTYLQFFVIEAVCMYCILSAVVAVLLLGVALSILRASQENERSSTLIPPIARGTQEKK